MVHHFQEHKLMIHPFQEHKLMSIQDAMKLFRSKFYSPKIEVYNHRSHSSQVVIEYAPNLFYEYELVIGFYNQSDIELKYYNNHDKTEVRIGRYTQIDGLTKYVFCIYDDENHGSNETTTIIKLDYTIQCNTEEEYFQALTIHEMSMDLETMKEMNAFMNDVIKMLSYYGVVRNAQ